MTCGVTHLTENHAYVGYMVLAVVETHEDVYFLRNEFVVISLGQLEMPNALHLSGKVVATPESLANNGYFQF